MTFSQSPTRVAVTAAVVISFSVLSLAAVLGGNSSLIIQIQSGLQFSPTPSSIRLGRTGRPQNSRDQLPVNKYGADDLSTSAGSITALGTPFIEDFSSLDTSAVATLPVGWEVDSGTQTTNYSSAGTTTTQSAGTTGPGALSSSTFGGIFNFANGATSGTDERAIGWLSGSTFASPRQLFLRMTNNTGSTITSLDISYDIEKYRSGSRAFTINFFSGSDGTAWTAQSAGDQSYAADANNTVVFNPPTSITKTLTLSGLSIANGSNYYLRWSYTGSGGSTNAQALGIDNFSVTAHGAVVTPVMTVDTASSGFTGDFGAVFVGNDSATQKFKVSGTDITGGIQIDAPANYSVALISAGHYGSSVTIPGSGSIAATDVFVRFHPTASGTASGNVAVSSSGAISVNVPVTSNGVQPQISFSSSTYSGPEGSNIVVTVSRSGDTSLTSSVVYSVSDGTAAAGTCGTFGKDYIADSNTLAFDPGESVKTFQVQLCSDRLSEDPAESINLTLSSPSNAILGAQNTAILKVFDAATEFTNSSPLTISAGGAASSQVTVSGYAEVIAGIRVTLFGVTSPNPDNLDMLLVSPSGQKFVIVGDVGGTSALNGATITLEDIASVRLPDNSTILDGQNYKPTSCIPMTTDFPTPAPAQPYVEPGCTAAVTANFANTFGGASPNGTWNLYIRDDGSSGLIAADSTISGWGMQIVLAPTAAMASISGRVKTADGAGIRNAYVTVSGGNLPEPITVGTSSFGYYTVGGLTSGQAYIVAVSARRYRFTPEARAVQLFEDVAGFDFAAER